MPSVDIGQRVGQNENSLGAFRNHCTECAGTVVLHVTPESAVGGPLALVRQGDEIELNVPERRLTLRVPDEEIAQRRAAWKPRPDGVTSGYLRMFLDHVLQADEGVDFDFLRGRRPVVDEDTAHGSRLA
jgi:hypothetical protein